MVGLLPQSARARLRRRVERARHSLRMLQRVAWVVEEFTPAGRVDRRWALARVLARRGLAPRRRVLFYPKHPSRGGVFFKSCVLLGYATTDRPDAPADVVIHYYGGAEGDAARLDELPAGIPVLNRQSLDVTKRHVQQTFERVFGYPLAVDPTVHAGPMVEKSDANGTHDGRILQGPIPRSALRPGFVYQRLIDNADGEGHTIDLRVPLLAGRIPLVYRKWRPPHDRFGRESVRVEICEPDAVFSAGERDRLLRLGREMGVDLAEMDVLRDNGDGRIYVVDVNNTPDGPARGLTRQGREEAMARLSRDFEAAVDAELASPR